MVHSIAFTSDCQIVRSIRLEEYRSPNCLYFNWNDINKNADLLNFTHTHGNKRFWREHIGKSQLAQMMRIKNSISRWKQCKKKNNYNSVIWPNGWLFKLTCVDWLPRLVYLIVIGRVWPHAKVNDVHISQRSAIFTITHCVFAFSVAVNFSFCNQAYTFSTCHISSFFCLSFFLSLAQYNPIGLEMIINKHSNICASLEPLKKHNSHIFLRYDNWSQADRFLRQSGYSFMYDRVHMCALQKVEQQFKRRKRKKHRLICLAVVFFFFSFIYSLHWPFQSKPVDIILPCVFRFFSPYFVVLSFFF